MTFEIMKNKIVFFVFLLLFIACKSENKFLYKETSVSIDERVADLLQRMTLEEKILQLNQYTLGRNTNVNNTGDLVKDIPPGIGSLIYFSDNPILRNKLQEEAINNTRLGIPIIFGYDAIHGFKTIFPIPLAQASSWNTSLVNDACEITAQEAKSSGVDWTFAPMVDVSRDPRWGRVAECFGEDPYTNAVFGEASIHGYQGTNNSKYRIAACLKHYVGYGASTAGMDYVYTEVSNQTLWDTYLVPFKRGIEAGALTVMSSFNDLSGVPTTANSYILRDILKDRWKHKGFVVSDWAAIANLKQQGIASDNLEAAEKAIIAGLDMDMVGRCYDGHLLELINSGRIPIDVVDEAVKRILYVKFKLGLFENPYVEPLNDKERFLLPNSIKVAEKLAEESIVLLKNENNTLPIGNIRNVALIGPMAKDKQQLLGSWSAHGVEVDVVSIYDGLLKEYGDKVNFIYSEGCSFDGEDYGDFDEALSIAQKADIIILCLGEKKKWSGENASRSTIALPEIQEKLLKHIKKSNKPIVTILSNGRPIELSRIVNLSDAVVEIWQPGIMGGKALAGILSGRVNPSGKLPITFPYSTGQIPTYYNIRPSARPTLGKYQDITSEPMFKFGYGLSYSEFEYGDIKVDKANIDIEDKIVVEIPVKNISSVPGYEVVHWYISDPVSSISRPIKELKFFEKKYLNPGEEKIFKFYIDPKRDFGYVDSNGKAFLESGTYYVIVKDKKVAITIND